MISCFINDSGTGIACLDYFGNGFTTSIVCNVQRLGEKFISVFRFFGENGFER